jgi:type II secretory pathway pseudopilin PulG
MKQIKTNKIQGFTAIELLFALGIIALATISIVYAMRGNSDKSNAQQMLTDVTAIINNVRNIHNSSSTGYTGLDTERAIGLSAFPTDLKINQTANTVGNQFVGGTVAITAADDTNFTLEYTQVPAAVCAQIVTQLAKVLN